MDSLLDPLRLHSDRSQSPAFMPREDDYAELLRNTDFDVRLQTLNRLVGIVRRDPEWFTKCARKGELFKNIDRILMDDRWEVQHQCIKFLQEAMITFGSPLRRKKKVGNLEYCMCYLMPNLIPKLGSSKITVRKISVQTIQTFLRHKPEALGSVLKTLSSFLLTSIERITKTEVMREFSAMFIPELVDYDWLPLLDALTKLLATSDTDTVENAALLAKKLEGLDESPREEIFLIYINVYQKIIELLFSAAEAIRIKTQSVHSRIEIFGELFPMKKKYNEIYLGKTIFTRMLGDLSNIQQKNYARFCTNIVVTTSESTPIAPSIVTNRSSMKLASGERRLRFGIVPSIVAAMVIDNTDVSTRISGLEKWKQLIENITSEEISRLVPHLHSYLISLKNVLNELNFKIVVLALDIVRLTVNRLKSHIEAHLQVDSTISQY
ncbi:hypothetical protein DICVIV_13109 [Dictyocaulus viviparus]|uniref:HEAT repeat protein n=1 Tax=Dictyocaulus viviparus TaxID=29172 RepID=A0A0D8XER9_DICVI|nr:hypothetical protein DICVIV_13109 [Dictyocaulus viviparus]